MSFNFNKKGRILETTIKIKKATLKADIDILLLFLSAIIISLINIIYIFGIF